MKHNEADITAAIKALRPTVRSLAYVRKNYAKIAAEADAELAALPKDRRVTKPLRGRPATGQSPVISLRLPAELLAWFKAQGKGYQTKMIRILEDAKKQAQRA